MVWAAGLASRGWRGGEAMSYTSGASDFLDRMALSSAQQAVVRVVPLLATPLFVWVSVIAGSPAHPVLSVGLVFLAVGAVLLPDSSVPLFLLLGLVGLWGLEVPEALSWWTLAAAGLLLVVHVAATLGGYGPPGLALAPGMLGLWARRAAVMAAATALVWLVAALLAGLDLPPSPVLLVVGLALVLGWTAWLGTRLTSRETPGATD